MKTIIAGAGETGFNIALELSESIENFNVLVIDSNAILLKEIQQILNIGIIHGSCTDFNTLAEGDTKNVDLFIACTNSDETNLVACMLAKEIGAKVTVALVRANLYRRQKLIRNYKNSGVDHVLNTTQQIVDEIFDVCMLNKNATEITTFADKKVTMLCAKISERSRLHQVLLKDVQFQGKYLIGGIIRDNQPFIPTGQDSILANDLAYFILPTEKLPDIKEDLDLEFLNYHKAVITGSDSVAYEIALGLSNTGLHTTIISPSLHSFRETQKTNKKRMIEWIEGNPTMVSLQLRADVPNSAVFVTMMEDYTNITACMLAKYLGTQKTVAMINHSDMNDVAKMAGVDVLFSRRLFSIRHVKKILLGDEVENYTTIGNTPLSVLTLDISKTAPVAGDYLKNIEFPQNSLVAVILDSKGKVAIPTGSTKLNPKDRVILFTMPDNIEKLKNFFL